MAANFKILVHRNSDNLHLKLMGDFDGSSAFELVDALKNNCEAAGKVFVHTGCLKNIHPFGRDMFHNYLNCLKNRRIRLIFTGSNAAEIAPDPRSEQARLNLIMA
ncbi:MAG: hypothetical protein HWN68_02665 [Desulfobacterales bacterium]|nr:hypothetical protein [Desulfobacterales bacterium]